MPSLQIIYASTSGHTEYVIDRLIETLSGQGDVACEKLRAERAQPDDLLRGDLLLLACGTWNTGSVEGQLNPHMHALLRDRAKDVDLHGRKVALIALGDERYHFTAAAMHHLQEFVRTHGGAVIEPALTIVNEPYGQEESIRAWAGQFASVV